MHVTPLDTFSISLLSLFTTKWIIQVQGKLPLFSTIFFLLIIYFIFFWKIITLACLTSFLVFYSFYFSTTNSGKSLKKLDSEFVSRVYIIYKRGSDCKLENCKVESFLIHWLIYKHTHTHTHTYSIVLEKFKRNKIFLLVLLLWFFFILV